MILWCPLPNLQSDLNNLFELADYLMAKMQSGVAVFVPEDGCDRFVLMDGCESVLPSQKYPSSTNEDKYKATLWSIKLNAVHQLCVVVH